MAKRSVAARGRVRVAMVLVAFLAVASAVIVRRSYGARRAGALHALEERRTSLVAERARLISDIGLASSLPELAPVVERKLGLRVPTDRQQVRIPRPAVPRGN